MKLRFIPILLVMAFASMVALAETKSDYDRSYNFGELKSRDFKIQHRMPTDPVGTNELWNRRIRDGLEQQLAANGFQKVTTGQPSFLVAYYMATKERYDTRYINYGFPGGWGRWGRWYRWGGWGGWAPGGSDVDVWKIPYTESTMVLGIIDSESNMLVWRGYDTETIDLNKSEKTIHKAIDNLVKRFVKDIEETKKKM